MDKYYPTVTDNGKTVYFSSDGYNAMGGLDLFVTTYNAVDKGWTIPTRLQPPFNSPSDDYYFLPLLATGQSIFCSNRQSSAGEIGVYEVHPRLRETISPVAEVKRTNTDGREAPPIESTASIITMALAGYNQVADSVNSEQEESPNADEDVQVVPEAFRSNAIQVDDRGITGINKNIELEPVEKSADNNVLVSVSNLVEENGRGGLAKNKNSVLTEGVTDTGNSVSIEGFYYSTDEPGTSDALIVVERDGKAVASYQTRPYPAGGDYKLNVPAPGNYDLKVTNGGGRELSGSLYVEAQHAQVCRQIVTGSDSLEQPFLTVLDCNAGTAAGESDISYGVQIGAFRETKTDLVMTAFSKLGVGRVTAIAKNEFTVFVTGISPDFYTTLKQRKELIERGIHDAFIIALKDNTFTSLEKAILAIR